MTISRSPWRQPSQAGHARNATSTYLEHVEEGRLSGVVKTEE